MSRIGKSPVVVPAGVEVAIAPDSISIKGPLGTAQQAVTGGVAVEQEGGELRIKVLDDSTKAAAMSGTLRALVSNMVTGVTKGFEKKLTLIGVGYKAAAAGAKLTLNVGYSHPVVMDMPAGIKVETATPTEVLIKGFDRQRVGQIAAEVRAVRPPEPYKGKGIRYSNETVAIKETKKK